MYFGFCLHTFCVFAFAIHVHLCFFILVTVFFFIFPRPVNFPSYVNFLPCRYVFHPCWLPHLCLVTPSVPFIMCFSSRSSVSHLWSTVSVLVFLLFPMILDLCFIQFCFVFFLHAFHCLRCLVFSVCFCLISFIKADYYLNSSVVGVLPFRPVLFICKYHRLQDSTNLHL